GRQMGKTVHLDIDIMHTAIYNSNAVILVFVPEKKNMNRMTEIMANMLRQSILYSSFTMKKRSKSEGVEADYDYEIRCPNNSVIRFFFMSNNPDKARGQRATHIYIDEAEYLPEKAWPVITGIVKGNPNISIWASSTPSGLENTWFRNFCETCAQENYADGNEYHLPSCLDDDWPNIEKRLRSIIFDEVTWQLEVMAEFVEAKGAVYKKDLIDIAVERSAMNSQYLSCGDYTATLDYRSGKKILGVDWNNPQNGVRLVEVAEVFGLPVVVRNEKIAYEEYTQTKSVQRIIELYKSKKYDRIAVDAGYGETQIEMIHRELLAMNVDPGTVLDVVDSNTYDETVLEYVDPKTQFPKRDVIKTRMKDKIVGELGKLIEDCLVFPKEEDETPSGIVKEVRNFRRKGAARQGGFIYSENTHSLSALQIAAHSWYNMKRTDTEPVASASKVLGSDLRAIIAAKPESTVIMRHGATSISRRTQGLIHGSIGKRTRSLL
ncbi:MAG TPA: hypothetical protein PLI62_13610, partial [Spirochaetota bacterium]|nr:hypothetical protein [Spirochaetota bacterium]